MAEEEKQVTIQELLAAFPGSPTKEQIELWKQEHGEIFCSALSVTELFIFRPLKRREYLEMQVQAQQPPTELVDGEQVVVGKCMLWGSDLGLKFLNCKAGSLTTLQEQILQNSNFIAPAVAGQLVVKL